MQLIVILIHVVVCVALILVVLLQKGKGADIGAAFGGGSSQTVFGGRGAASFMHKLTAAAAIIFMLTSLGLAFQFGRGRAPSVMDGAAKPPVQQQSQGTAPAGNQPK